MSNIIDFSKYYNKKSFFFKMCELSLCRNTKILSLGRICGKTYFWQKYFKIMQTYNLRNTYRQDLIEEIYYDEFEVEQ